VGTGTAAADPLGAAADADADAPGAVGVVGSA